MKPLPRLAFPQTWHSAPKGAGESLSEPGSASTCKPWIFRPSHADKGLTGHSTCRNYLRNRSGLAILIDGDKSKSRIRHLVALAGEKAFGESLDVNLH